MYGQGTEDETTEATTVATALAISFLLPTESTTRISGYWIARLSTQISASTMTISSSEAQKRPLISRKERPSALNGPRRSNSSAGIASDQTVPSQSAGIPHGSEK